MRRLKFPIALPSRPGDPVMTFEAPLEALRPLGEPEFIGGECSWAFETDAGLRFQVQWSEPTALCTVVADPPDFSGTASALRTLGLEGQRFILPSGQARWQLWRQDDHGTHFMMAEFDERSAAMAEMERMERRGHKQTYWVSQREALSGSP